MGCVFEDVAFFVSINRIQVKASRQQFYGCKSAKSNISKTKSALALNTFLQASFQKVDLFIFTSLQIDF
jgi:hypothetical protein